MSDNALVVQNNRLAIMPVMDNTTAMMRRQAIIDFTKSVMVKDVDYGTIPGTGDKPTLKKPGAEKLTSLFGLSPRFDIVERDNDWTGRDHGGEPFFYFQYRCSLYYGDVLAGQGLGSCNSWEKKYRYRKAERTCPNCGQASIIKGKSEYGGGWICFTKKNGCGAKFGDHDPAIVDQETGQVLNDNPADLVNTVDKMAQKRALVAAVLIAVNASEFFTQDIEDMDFGTEIIDVTPRQNAPQRQAPQSNGKHPAPVVSWEDLPPSPATASGDKWSQWRGILEKNKKPTVTTVCSCLTNSGAYHSEADALAAALNVSADLEKGTTLTNDDALALFDALYSAATSSEVSNECGVIPAKD